MPDHESFQTIYSPDYIVLEGSIDDEETFKTIMHFVNIIVFKEGESRQVKVKLGDIVYYICPGDTQEQVKNQRDKRHYLTRRSHDRREADRRKELDRRKTD